MNKKRNLVLLLSITISYIVLNAQNADDSLTAYRVLSLMRENLNGKWNRQTVDTFKTGNPGDKVKGIATCMFVDMNVLKKAVENNCNVIITHEPFNYIGIDNIPDYLKNDDVLNEKLSYIKEHNLIILRWHDHAHSNDPDQIMHGMALELGWKVVSLQPMIFETGEQKLSDLAEYIADFFDIDAVRVIGDPENKIKRIGFIPGLAPTTEMHIGTLGRPDVDAVIIGEAREWEVYVYARDAFQQHKNKSAVFIGHLISEEPGMKYCADWLKTFIPAYVPVIFIKDESMWWSPEKN
jgi:putative NIF3 family GTP cyclohydrolase 1 type 2